MTTLTARLASSPNFPLCAEQRGLNVPNELSLFFIRILERRV